MRKLLLSWLVVMSCCVGNTVLAAPQTGWWWNPAESGRGFFVESDNGITFIGAYLYDSEGRAMWLVSGNANPDPYNYSGDLYNKSNGQTLYGNYVAPGPANSVGNISVRFTDDTHGIVTWPGGTVAIERQIFDTRQAAFQPFSGWWWDPNESGSGYSVEVQGNNLFIVAFMYDDAGRPVWYFSAGPMSSDNTFSQPVYLYANGQTMTGPYRPPGTPTAIATLDVTFKGENQAEFTFTELPAAAASGLQPRAGRTSTRTVQPQFPKPSIYVGPQQFVGPFKQDFKSKATSGGVVTSDGHAVESFDMRWNKITSRFPLPPSDNDVYEFVGGNMTYSWTGKSLVTVPGAQATCNNSGSTSVALGPGGAKASLTVYINRSYILNVEVPEGAVSLPTSGQCQSDDLVTPFNPTQPSPLILFNYEGVVVGDTISGGGIKTIITGPVTTTWTYSWNFVGIRP